MKNLFVAVLFVSSLASVFAASRVEALNSPRIELRAHRPEMLPMASKKDGGTDDDESGEEELTGAEALALVDPPMADAFVKVQLALLSR